MIFVIILIVLGFFFIIGGSENNDSSFTLAGLIFIIVGIGIGVYIDKQYEKTPEYKNEQLKNELERIQDEKDEKEYKWKLHLENKQLQDSLYKLKRK